MRPILLLPLALGACSDPAAEPREPEPTPTDALAAPAIQVEPVLIDFGLLRDGEVKVDAFTVTNVGTADLTVSEIALPLSAFSLPSNGHGFELAPGASEVVDVAFVSDGQASHQATATVRSDDPDRPAVAVDLVGFGAVPDLRITPEVHDFGSLFVGCSDTVTLTLESLGTDTVVVQGLDFDGDESLALVDPPTEFPISLAPGQTLELLVGYAPAAPGAHEAVLGVTSTDPAGVDRASQRGDADWAGTTTDRFEVPVDPPVDILFAVDRSHSMAPQIDELNAAFTTFITRIGEVTDGWQVGVVTQPDGCFSGGIIAEDTPNYEQVFRDATQSGEETRMSEMLLLLSNLTMDQTGPGQCNEGFGRPGAALSVIVVSDEPEQSGEPWVFLVAGLQTHVSPPEYLRISGVVDYLEQCGHGAEGYLQAVDLTGGLVLDVCDSAWGERVEELADVTLAPLREFPLSETPVESTIEVYVDGVYTPAGWAYDPVKQAVIFAGTPFGGGEELLISYALAEVTCP